MDLAAHRYRHTRALGAKTGMKNLCLPDGLALGCVATSKVLREGYLCSRPPGIWQARSEQRLPAITFKGQTPRMLRQREGLLYGSGILTARN